MGHKANFLESTALTDFKGQTNLICYRRNYVIANVGYKKKQVEGTMNLHPL